MDIYARDVKTMYSFWLIKKNKIKYFQKCNQMNPIGGATPEPPQMVNGLFILSH